MWTSNRETMDQQGSVGVGNKIRKEFCTFLDSKWLLQYSHRLKLLSTLIFTLFFETFCKQKLKNVIFLCYMHCGRSRKKNAKGVLLLILLFFSLKCRPFRLFYNYIISLLQGVQIEIFFQLEYHEQFESSWIIEITCSAVPTCTTPVLIVKFQHICFSA